MVDRPVIFSAPMVRALLEGRKSQTRRILKPYNGPSGEGVVIVHEPWCEGMRREIARFKPPYAVGDRLWVRENYYQRGHWERRPGHMTRSGKREKWAFVPADNVITFQPPCAYRKGRHTSDPYTGAWHQRIARFMPRRFSRLTLTVTDVRVERLQEISEEDARAEGIVDGGCLSCGMPEPCGCRDPRPDARDAFAGLWNSIHGPEAWQANPWIVVIGFSVERNNIDAAQKT